MHLSRTYPWRLDLSERELTVVEKCLAGEELSEDEDRLAEHLLVNIRTFHNKATTRRKALSKTVITSQLNSTEEVNPWDDGDEDK